jgi:hypothetical protein
MCAVEQDEARLLPETKHDLGYHIMNVDGMESEEFPMSPEIIAHEQKKDTNLKEVMKKSDKLSERIVERSTVITYENKINIPISLRKRIVWWYHTYLQHPGITRMEATLRQNLVKLLPLPQPPVCARTDVRTNPIAQRATQLRSVLARVYAVSIQNQITTTVP